MTHEEIIQVVSELSYKPNIKIVYSVFEGQPEISIRAKTEDATGKEPNFQNALVVRFDPMQAEFWNERGFLDFLLHEVILKYEEHEAVEWFKRNGKTVFSPHSETAKPNPLARNIIP